MTIFMNILRVVFVLFLLYTWLYVFQWLAGLVVAQYTLARSYRRKDTVRQIVPDEPARKNPISVIIAAFNEENCVIQTIESIMREDYPKMEIILVDDGSTDRTAQKVIDHFHLQPAASPALSGKYAGQIEGFYQRQFPFGRLSLITKRNGGKASALNCGLDFCSTPYCVILDADTLVEKGSFRAMMSQFLSDSRTIVCAGVVGNYQEDVYQKLTLPQKGLVLFQTLEYYRTFYLQRILLDRLNANVVVSGAFAMFDTACIEAIGGYREDTIGEDMELAMRLHAFCRSNRTQYHISYIPEAKCRTQFPFRYRDFFRQRRRWQIGMMQSICRHGYMLLNRHYGWVGLFAGSIFLMYEMFAPFVEMLGLSTLAAAFAVGILDVQNTATILLVYYLLMLLTQCVLISSLNTYSVEKLPWKRKAALLLIACLEPFSFHIFTSTVKLIAILTNRKHSRTWQHIERVKADSQKEKVSYT